MIFHIRILLASIRTTSRETRDGGLTFHSALELLTLQGFREKLIRSIV